MFKNSEKQLLKALEESRGTYTISKDGYVSLDMTHPKVRESFREQADMVRKLVAEGKLIDHWVKYFVREAENGTMYRCITARC